MSKSTGDREHLRHPHDVIKVGGHCYNEMGYTTCHFWRANPGRCDLFGEHGVKKSDSRALVICDKVYGKDYKGRP